MANPTANGRTGKAAKPYKDFPLTPHPSGRWCKRIHNKLHYFGPIGDPDAALQRYLDTRDDLYAGRVPRAAGDGLRVKDMCNAFLTSKLRQLHQGDLKASTFYDYTRATDELVAFFGAARRVEDLGPADFGSLKTRLAGRLGVIGLLNAITRARVPFRWAYKNGLLEQPVQFGSEFDAPSARLRRLDRAGKPVRLFTAEQLRMLIREAPSVNLKAAILLAINGGFAAHDLAALPMEAVNLETGVIDFVRPKTGVRRRVPLWPESVAALQEVLACRKPPKDEAHARLVFINKFGKPYLRQPGPEDVQTPAGGKIKVTGLRTDGLGQEFGKLLTAKGLARRGVRFYALRHTCRDVADAVADQRAIDVIMGHLRERDIANAYRHTIDDARLRRVSDHVRAWLEPWKIQEDL